MSRTIRRKDYEHTYGKVEGSKVSGIGVYTNVSFEKFKHPYKKYYSYKEDKMLPCVVYLTKYDTCDLNDFYRNYYNIHAENGYNKRMNPNKRVRSIIKSKYNQSVKKYISNYKKYGDNVEFNPTIRATHSAHYYI